MIILKRITLFSFLVLGFMACGDDDSAAPTDNLTLNFSGLENLGDQATYEGWLIVDGNAVSTGTFDVDDSGALSQTAFTVDQDDLDNAATFVLTIEPVSDNDPAPSDVHILAGDFNGTSAALTVDHGAALANDFTSAAGGYILATPTDMDDTNERSGVWWLDPSLGPGAALNLPTLPAGWAYEGWAVVDGTPVSTGTFTDAAQADAAAAYSGDQPGPPFPGEDFLQNAPNGLTFPTDLAGKTVVISIEPVPDNSPAPFTLKPLVGPVPADAADHTFYQMNNNASATNPTGTAGR